MDETDPKVDLWVGRIAMILAISGVSGMLLMLAYGLFCTLRHLFS